MLMFMFAAVVLGLLAAVAGAWGCIAPTRSARQSGLALAARLGGSAASCFIAWFVIGQAMNLGNWAQAEFEATVYRQTAAAYRAEARKLAGDPNYQRFLKEKLVADGARRYWVSEGVTRTAENWANEKTIEAKISREVAKR